MLKLRIGKLRCCGIAVWASVVCVALSSSGASGSNNAPHQEKTRKRRNIITNKRYDALDELQHDELQGPDGGLWKKYGGSNHNHYLCPFYFWSHDGTPQMKLLSDQMKDSGHHAYIFRSCLEVENTPNKSELTLPDRYLNDYWIPAKNSDQGDAKLVMGIVIGGMFLVIIFASIVFFKMGQQARPAKPKYWMWRHKIKAFDDNFHAVIDVSKDLRATFQKMFDMNAGVIGQGRDAHGMSHTGLNILMVQRVENGKLWTKYARTKANVKIYDQEHRDLFKEHGQEVPRSIANSSPEGKAFLEKLNLDEERGETLLFHGAPSRGSYFPSGWQMTSECCAIRIISQQGFDERLGQLDGMFGSGVYFADKCTKADAYAGRYSETDSSVGEIASMYVSRVMLGSSYVSKQSLPKLRRPPCVHGHFDPRLLGEELGEGDIPWASKFPHTCFARCRHPLCSSVISDMTVNNVDKNYREFVVYDGDMAYPEFLITYQRVGPGGSTEDPHAMRNGSRSSIDPLVLDPLAPLDVHNPLDGVDSYDEVTNGNDRSKSSFVQNDFDQNHNFDQNYSSQIRMYGSDGSMPQYMDPTSPTFQGQSPAAYPSLGSPSYCLPAGREHSGRHH